MRVSAASGMATLWKALACESIDYTTGEENTMAWLKTRDGIRLYHTDRGTGKPLVLLHGWSFSGSVFDPVIPALTENARVISVDLRGHGESDKPHHGYRVSRLAADLRELITTLDLREATLLGWSVGGAVIWSYLELFGDERIAKLVLAQQTPRQFAARDWKWAHAQCFDPVNLAVTMTMMQADVSAFDRQNIADCVHRAATADERAAWIAQTSRCPIHARVALMTDHGQHDWRDFIPTISLPTLVLAACKDPVFPAEGVAWVGKHIPGARTVYFENSSHMLFHDEPERFVESVREFLGAP
ncbi:alpha/beta fold hydrolase [Robbsia andropogonis]|uniref:alpha/beta fold hydrolase n=1 Tax=Robbsia andropogonis TaxID=28092 RepID=UPI003D214B17